MNFYLVLMEQIIVVVTFFRDYSLSVHDPLLEQLSFLMKHFPQHLLHMKQLFPFDSSHVQVLIILKDKIVNKNFITD